MFKQSSAVRQAPLHFRRIEIKYLVPDRLVPSFIERIAPYTQPDPYLIEEGKGRRSYPVTSLYFDSIDLQSLFEKDAGLLSRRRIRLRTYEEEFSEVSQSFLEIKRRHDVVVSKDRLSLSFGHLNSSLPMSHLIRHVLKRVEASEEVTHEANILAAWYNLQSTAFVTYRRMPFVGMQDRRFRITVDSRLRGAWKPPQLLGPQLLTSVNPGRGVIELKCNHAVPEWFHDVVQEFGLTRLSHSKYALSAAVLREKMKLEI